MKERNVHLCHVVSHDQIADVLTKPLHNILFDTYKMMMGMKDRSKDFLTAMSMFCLDTYASIIDAFT